MLDPPFHMLIVAMTACGKTHYLLQAIEKEFKGIFASSSFSHHLAQASLNNANALSWLSSLKSENE